MKFLFYYYMALPPKLYYLSTKCMRLIFTLSQYFQNNSKTITYHKFGNNLAGYRQPNYTVLQNAYHSTT